MIIGLTGIAGSGKSEVAAHLESEHGFARLNMKDALIRDMKERFKETLDAISTYYGGDVDSLFHRKPKIMRALMQNYGTDVRRDDDPEYWVKLWKSEADKLTQSGEHIVVDDVRFFNEADAIKMDGGVIVRVVMDGLLRATNHISELETDKIEEDFTIVSTKGDVHKLKRLMDSVISEIKANVD